MTTLEGALADNSALTPFEGQDVLAAGIEIPKAAGGLQEALAIDPEEFHHGEVRYVVLKVEVAKVRFDPIPKTKALRRVHVFSPLGATFVDSSLVTDALDAQAEKIEKAKADGRGIQAGPLDDELHRAELAAEHDEGDHEDEKAEGCVHCYPDGPDGES